MNRIPHRYQLPAVIAVAVVVVLLVAGGVLVAGRLAPTPSPTTTSSPHPSASASPNAATPEGAVRAMFEAFARARPTNDPSLVLPFVTSEDSPAYLSVRGFLEGQQGLGQGAIITAQQFEDMSVEADDDTATVTFTYVETGYLINIDTGEPKSSPDATEPTTIVARVVLQGTMWLVEEYEST